MPAIVTIPLGVLTSILPVVPALLVYLWRSRPPHFARQFALGTILSIAVGAALYARFWDDGDVFLGVLEVRDQFLNSFVVLAAAALRVRQVEVARALGVVLAGVVLVSMFCVRTKRSLFQTCAAIAALHQFVVGGSFFPARWRCLSCSWPSCPRARAPGWRSRCRSCRPSSSRSR